jgi:hypothetical protein
MTIRRIAITAFLVLLADLGAFAQSDTNDEALKFIQSLDQKSQASPTEQASAPTAIESIKWLNSHLGAYAFSSDQKPDDWSNGEYQSLVCTQYPFQLNGDRLEFVSTTRAYIKREVTSYDSRQIISVMYSACVLLIEVEKISIPLANLALVENFGADRLIGPTRAPELASPTFEKDIFRGAVSGLILETTDSPILIETHYFREETHVSRGPGVTSNNSKLVVYVKVDGRPASADEWPPVPIDILPSNYMQPIDSHLLSLHSEPSQSQELVLPVFHEDQDQSKEWATGTFNALKTLANLAGAKPGPFMPGK